MEIKDTPIQRFKLIITKEKRFYLVDVDTYKITWLFPTVTWYLKNNAIEITNEEFDQLKLEKKLLIKK